jgi:hypothetical protein
MATVVTQTEVQQWLDETKCKIESVDPALAETYTDIVFGSLALVYDISVWVDTDTTPQLVRKVISMLIAARTYKRQYSEEVFNTQGESYGDNLESYANSIISGLVTKAIEIPGTQATDTGEEDPSFYPNDAAGKTGCWPFQRLEVGAGEGRKFSIGQVF